MSIITFRQSNREYTEAVGSLYQREVLAYLVSLKYNYNFIRSNFKFYKKHNKNLKTGNFDNLFKFFNNSKKILKNYQIINLSNIKQIKKKNYVYNLPFHISEKFISLLSFQERTDIIKKFRKNFWKHNKKKINRNKDFLQIVLHIRNSSKGDTIFGNDTLPYQLFSFDYGLPNNNPIFYKKWYVSMVRKIIKENKSSKKLKIYICSTGKKKDFFYLKKELSKFCQTNFYLNIDEYKTFKKMILADYLVLSQSSFSYLASMISNGKKYIRNGFRHPLPSDVEVINDRHLLKLTYFQFLYFKSLEKIAYFMLFIKNTEFKKIIKNKFKFF